MRTSSRLAAIAASTFLFADFACAVTITIEPDDFAPGADMSNPAPGVQLSTWANSNFDGFFHFESVSVVRDQNCIDDPYFCKAVTGSQYLDGPGFISEAWGIPSVANCFTDAGVRAGTAQCGGGSGFGAVMRALIVQLDQPTNFFEISGTWQNDHIEAYAFDSNFNMVGTMDLQFDMTRCHLSPEFPQPTEYCANTASLFTDTPQISYVLAGSWAGIGWLDTIRFERAQGVPEPGTLALLGLGLAGLGFARRKQLI